MIAREGTESRLAGPRRTGLIDRLIMSWRRALTRALGGSARAARAAAGMPRASVSAGQAFVANGAFSDLRHPALGWFGVVAVCLGAAGGIVLASPGLDRRAAALAGFASLMWMAIRWLVLRSFAETSVREDPAGLRGSYSVGLLCYALALTPELRLAAWVCSAALTSAVLARTGRDRGEWTRAVAIAWGAHALVAVSGWLARNAFVAYFALRG
jgi:hypothetical protein